MTEHHETPGPTAPGSHRGEDGTPLRVGVVGAGFISAQYSASLRRPPQLRVTAVADAVGDRAAALAAEHEGARALPPAELLAADDVDVVLNLTLPSGHADVARQALAAGKHVDGEKPLATTRGDARDVLHAAGLRVGCAPGTVLGTGVQTARAVLDAGEIGVPHAAPTTLVMSFDTWAVHLPNLEVHGSGGSLSVPDPSHRGGAVDVARARAGAQPRRAGVGRRRRPGRLPRRRPRARARRMALALRAGRAHRASAEPAQHVVDVMACPEEAAATGTGVATTTTCERPEAVPTPVDLSAPTPEEVGRG